MATIKVLQLKIAQYDRQFQQYNKQADQLMTLKERYYRQAHAKAKTAPQKSKALFNQARRISRQIHGIDKRAKALIHKMQQIFDKLHRRKMSYETLVKLWSK